MWKRVKAGSDPYTGKSVRVMQARAQKANLKASLQPRLANPQAVRQEILKFHNVIKEERAQHAELVTLPAWLPGEDAQAHTITCFSNFKPFKSSSCCNNVTIVVSMSVGFRSKPAANVIPPGLSHP